MKINDIGRIGNVNPYKKSQGTASVAKGEGKSRSKDEVQISSEAMALLETNKGQQTRQDRVESLKNAVQEGTYVVGSDQIARKLLQNWKASE
jgi:negative regulator of flagellin synthesis FlgM